MYYWLVRKKYNLKFKPLAFFRKAFIWRYKKYHIIVTVKIYIFMCVYDRKLMLSRPAFILSSCSLLFRFCYFVFSFCLGWTFMHVTLNFNQLFTPLKFLFTLDGSLNDSQSIIRVRQVLIVKL